MRGERFIGGVIRFGAIFALGLTSCNIDRPDAPIVPIPDPDRNSVVDPGNDGAAELGEAGALDPECSSGHLDPDLYGVGGGDILDRKKPPISKEVISGASRFGRHSFSIGVHSSGSYSIELPSEPIPGVWYPGSHSPANLRLTLQIEKDSGTPHEVDVYSGQTNIEGRTIPTRLEYCTNTSGDIYVRPGSH